VEQVRRGFAEARLLDILAPSAERVAPPCIHYETCGGCDLQHLSAAGQLRAKRGQVQAALRRIGGLADVAVGEVVPSGSAWGYRFRMDFDWDHDKGPVIGLHQRGHPERIVPITRCLLAGDVVGDLLPWLAREAATRRLAAFDRRRQRGFLRRTTVQEGHGTRELLVTLETARGDPPALLDLARALRRRFPRIVGVVRVEHARDGQLVGESILEGRDHLFEEIEGDRFKIPAGAFFQPNPSASLPLRRHAVDALRLSGTEKVLELYCGVGFFSVALARRCAAVTAVEGVRSACAAARENASRAGVDRCRFLAGDVARELPALLESSWDAVLVDPPRVGLAPTVVQGLARSAAPRLVYVSCDPATMARDLGVLVGGGAYRVAQVTPFDLFPQTQHVECVAGLERT
jgi:23S rRNA (uracil1939-C5)-methyltransferase